MIYYTGDIHGSAKGIVAFAQHYELTESDIIVILGDVGANYYGNRRDRYCKDALAKIKPTVFCVHGNHERRPDTLAGYKQKEWNGGLVWYEDEYPNLLFARDGDIFTMEGTRHLVIGGAYSVDKYYRLENDLLWFADEQPSAEIKTYALDKAELSKLNETVGVPAIDITGTSIANKLDKVMAQALDANCQIVRTRVNKQSLGCDGLLEFIARKEQVSPELIVELISSSPETFEECKAKYKNLVLHNIVLAILGFRVETRDEMQMLQLCQKFYEMYPGLKNEWDTVEEWIAMQFNSIHTQTFSNRPYYHYEGGMFTRKI